MYVFSNFIISTWSSSFFREYLRVKFSSVSGLPLNHSTLLSFFVSSYVLFPIFIPSATLILIQLSYCTCSSFILGYHDWINLDSFQSSLQSLFKENCILFRSQFLRHILPIFEQNSLTEIREVIVATFLSRPHAQDPTFRQKLSLV